MNDHGSEGDHWRSSFFDRARLERASQWTEAGAAEMVAGEVFRRLGELQRLARVATEMNELAVALHVVRVDEGGALSYLSKPGSNGRLGRASLARAVTKRRCVLQRLKADRERVHAMLGELETGPDRGSRLS